MNPRQKDPYINYSTLSVNAQRVFAHIERILRRYNVKEMHITKEDLSYETTMSIPGIKVALRELKQKGYIVPKNHNSPIIRVGDLYSDKSGGENGD